jgi:SAM-dependent methyltransferase
MQSHSVPAPSAWVTRFAPTIRSGGRVLDLAAGSGRHARRLAAMGFDVTAVDRDVEGLAGFPGRIVALDLEGGRAWSLGGEWDAIVVTNYLHRPLFAALAGALGENGLLLYETFAAGNERFGKPSNPDFLLRPGELLGALAALTIVAFEQGAVAAPRPAVVQRLAARRGAWPAYLP